MLSLPYLVGFEGIAATMRATLPAFIARAQLPMWLSCLHKDYMALPVIDGQWQGG
jgi:hypothetical protein